MIPRRLHRTVPEHTTDEVEGYWEGWIDLHPGWRYMTWRDPILPVNADDFPMTGDLFDRVSGAQLAGLVRLEALYHWGGIYLDSDVEPIRPLDALLCHPCFVVREDARWCNDAVIGAEPAHPFILACIYSARLIIENGGDPGESGPRNLTDVLSDGFANVTVLASRAFCPVHYIEKARLPEPGTAAEHFPESYGLHRWAASWVT